MNYWLLKTEPITYSWDELERKGFRNVGWGFRNTIKPEIICEKWKVGEQTFIYHSGENPGIMGIAEVNKGILS